MNLTKDSKRFPVGLCKHWKTCEYDDCPKCSQYISWIHRWQRENPNSDKVLKRTIGDLTA